MSLLAVSRPIPPAIVGLLLLLVFIAPALRFRLWRGGSAVRQLRQTMSRSWPMPLSWLDALSRAIPLMYAAGISVILLLGLAELLGHFGLVAATVDSIQRYVAFAAIGVMALVLLIVLVNRPSALVPRDLRGEPGLVVVAYRMIRGLFTRESRH